MSLSVTDSDSIAFQT